MESYVKVHAARCARMEQQAAQAYFSRLLRAVGAGGTCEPLDQRQQQQQQQQQAAEVEAAVPVGATLYRPVVAVALLGG